MLNYIFSFFIFIATVSSFYGLTVLTSNKTTKVVKEFEETTRKTLDQKGFGTILGMSLLFLTSILVYFLASKTLLEYREFQYRKKSYLCLNRYITDLKNYTERMQKVNLTYAGMDIALLTGAGLELEAARKYLDLLRDGIHISFMKNIITNKYCSIDQKLYLQYYSPYKLTELKILETSVDGSTIVRSNKWELNLVNFTSGIRYDRLFNFRVKLKLKSYLHTVEIISIEEIQTADLSNLKRFSSFP